MNGHSACSVHAILSIRLWTRLAIFLDPITHTSSHLISCSPSTKKPKILNIKQLLFMQESRVWIWLTTFLDSHASHHLFLSSFLCTDPDMQLGAAGMKSVQKNARKPCSGAQLELSLAEMAANEWNMLAYLTPCKSCHLSMYPWEREREWDG